jgi:cell division protein DivIC
MKSRHLLAIGFVVLLLGLGIYAGTLLVAARAEYQQLKQTERATRQKLAEAEARLHEQEIVLHRLQTDPAFVERAVRDRLHYGKPGEAIFRFED